MLANWPLHNIIWVITWICLNTILQLSTQVLDSNEWGVLVYKIPYRRTRAWPSAREQSYLAYKCVFLVYVNMQLQKSGRGSSLDNVILLSHARVRSWLRWGRVKNYNVRLHSIYLCSRVYSALRFARYFCSAVARPSALRYGILHTKFLICQSHLENELHFFTWSQSIEWSRFDRIFGWNWKKFQDQDFGPGNKF